MFVCLLSDVRWSSNYQQMITRWYALFLCYQIMNMIMKLSSSEHQMISSVCLFVCLFVCCKIIYRRSSNDQQMNIKWSKNYHHMIIFASVLWDNQQMIIQCLFVCLLSDNQHMLMKWSSDDKVCLFVCLFVCLLLENKWSSNDQQMLTRW